MLSGGVACVRGASWWRHPGSPGEPTDGATVRSQIVLVDDPIGIALLGEEPLPVLREVRVHRVARDDRVEVRGLPLRLGPQQASQALQIGRASWREKGWPSG